MPCDEGKEPPQGQEGPERDLVVSGLAPAEEGALALSIPGKLEPMPFYPESEATFFATERPWELEFGDDGSIILTTWGETTTGQRLP